MSGLTHNVSAQADELLDHIYEYGTNSEGVIHRINQLCDAAVEQLRAELERLNSCTRYEQHRAERIGTHGPGCETWGPAHYECAVQEIEKLQHSLADYEETNEKYLARIVWFDGQLAASRRELVGASKSARAQARIIESLQQQRAHLHAQRDQWIEARDTLDSERAANACLTEELAASREREARMREAGQRLLDAIEHDTQIHRFSILWDGLRAALAEGAQG